MATHLNIRKRMEEKRCFDGELSDCDLDRIGGKDIKEEFSGCFAL
jgi:hypothetical protein